MTTKAGVGAIAELSVVLFFFLQSATLPIMEKRLIWQKPGSLANRCMKRMNDTKWTYEMSEARTNEVVNVVVVIERNTAVCLVSFVPLPKKVKWNERAEWSVMELYAAKRSTA